MIRELIEQINILEQDGFDAAGEMIDALDNWDTEAEDRVERKMDAIFHNIRNRERAIIHELQMQVCNDEPIIIS